MGCNNSRIQVSARVNGAIQTKRVDDHIIFVSCSDFRLWALKKFFDIPVTEHYKYNMMLMNKFDNVWVSSAISEQFGHPDYVRLYKNDTSHIDFKLHYQFL